MRTLVLPFEKETIPEWDRFNNQSPTGTVFTSATWLMALGGIPKLSVRIVAVESDDRWLCGVPLAIRTKGSYRTALPIGASPYFGIILSPLLDSRSPHEDVSEVTTLLASEILKHVHYVEIPNVPSLVIGARAPEGWEIEVRKTSTRDLRTTGETESPDKELRYQLRRAQRANLSVETPGDPGVFFNLLRDAFKAKHLDLPLSRAHFMRLFKALNPSSRVSIHLARRRAEVAAGAAILRDANAYYYWIAATNPAFRSTGASYLLLDQIVRDLHGKGPEVLDLVGANVPSVARFKAHFASKTEAYNVLRAHSSRIAKLTRQVYQRVRRVGRRR